MEQLDTEDWKLFKHLAQKKRANNRMYSTNLLQSLNIPIEIKNNGAHLVVKSKNNIIDFWPGTGKFIERNTNKKGRGVKQLLKLCAT